jgi:hypothetical protein
MRNECYIKKQYSDETTILQLIKRIIREHEQRKLSYYLFSKSFIEAKV